MSYDNFGAQLRDLDNRVDDVEREMENRLEDLERKLRSLDSQMGDVHDLDYELRSIKDDIEDAESNVRGISSDLRSYKQKTAADIKRLTTRLAALEANARTGEDAPTADLDTVSADWRDLARVADRTRATRIDLLSSHERADRDRTIQGHRNAVKQHASHRGQVLATAKILATTSPTDAEHKKATWSFRAAVNQEAASAGKRAATARQAEDALAELEDDAALREGKATVLEKGSKAQVKLQLLLRSRLAEAIAERALLPMWFVTVLGPIPPAEQAEEWMSLATRVWAYRVTYEITDPVVALGAPPAPHPAHRKNWYGKLDAELADWNR